MDASAGCVIDLLVAVTARQPILQTLCSPGCPRRFHIMADGFWKVIVPFSMLRFALSGSYDDDVIDDRCRTPILLMYSARQDGLPQDV